MLPNAETVTGSIKDQKQLAMLGDNMQELSKSSGWMFLSSVIMGQLSRLEGRNSEIYPDEKTGDLVGPVIRENQIRREITVLKGILAFPGECRTACEKRIREKE
jgi:hypothetical protein